jgi:hypothetical protein
VKVVRDPNGRVMIRTYFEHTGTDGNGSFTFILRSAEEFSVAPNRDAPEGKWVAAWLPLTDEQYAKLSKDTAWTNAQLLVEASYQEAAALRHRVASLEADDAAKTEDLRRLQRERDPARNTATIAQAVKELTSALEDQVRQQAQEKVALQREIDELKASKKRLKEANERLKAAKS